MKPEIDKSKFKGGKGDYIVQNLFLEDKYDTDVAVFTFDGEDKVHKGKTYISLKKRYLEFGDPNEYLFAKHHLYDWGHWQRMCKNKVLRPHIDQWREELNLQLMSEGIQQLISIAVDDEKPSYQAAKYLADGGWIKNEVGRPSKEQVEGELKRRADEEAEWMGGVSLLEEHRAKKKR